MLFRTDPSEPWKGVDFALLLALQIMEDETCGQCGHPIWICRSERADVYFSVDKMKCHATEAIRRKEHNMLPRKQQEQVTKAEKAMWGVVHYAVPQIAKNSVMPELPSRKDYYESQMR